jgi:hypothetical protein
VHTALSGSGINFELWPRTFCPLSNTADRKDGDPKEGAQNWWLFVVIILIVFF